MWVSGSVWQRGGSQYAGLGEVCKGNETGIARLPGYGRAVDGAWAAGGRFEDRHPSG